MGRFNWMLRVIRKTSAVVCIVGLPGSAQAFSPQAAIQMGDVQLGACSVYLYKVGYMGLAYVGVDQQGVEFQPNDYYYRSMQPQTTNSKLTETIIEDCIGGAPDDVINYTPVDINAGGYYDQNIMGFAFTMENTISAFGQTYLGGVTYDYYIVAIDTTAPTVALSGPTDIVTDAFTVTATFSENVVGFELGDITVTNGTASALVADDALEYTFTVTPKLGTTVSVSISAGVADDAAGNANTASNTLSVQAGSPESYFAEQEAEIQAIITKMLHAA